jgi:hypothetical protein
MCPRLGHGRGAIVLSCSEPFLDSIEQHNDILDNFFVFTFLPPCGSISREKKNPVATVSQHHRNCNMDFLTILFFQFLELIVILPDYFLLHKNKHHHCLS